MFDINRQIVKILSFDNLYKYLNLNKFNDEEKELIKVISYHNQQFNFHDYYKTNLNQNVFLILNKIKIFFNLKRIFKMIFHIISIVFKDRKSFPKLSVDIIFFISMDPKSQKDMMPIVNNFTNKIILVDKSHQTYQAYKKVFKKQKIINVQNYIELKDYFSSFIKSLKFLLCLL